MRFEHSTRMTLVARVLALVAAIVVAALAVSGCASPTPAPPPPTSTPRPVATAAAPQPQPAATRPLAGNVLKQSTARLVGELLINPFPPQVRRSTGLKLTLRDSSGQPIKDAKVLFDLTMPSMRMPANQTVATITGDGIYEANVVFTMGGGWAIAAVVTRGDTQERLVYTLSIR